MISMGLPAKALHRFTLCRECSVRKVLVQVGRKGLRLGCNGFDGRERYSNYHGAAARTNEEVEFIGLLLDGAGWAISSATIRLRGILGRAPVHVGRLAIVFAQPVVVFPVLYGSSIRVFLYLLETSCLAQAVSTSGFKVLEVQPGISVMSFLCDEGHRDMDRRWKSRKSRAPAFVRLIHSSME